MTEQTLDRFARALATGMPRRSMMKVAAATVAGVGSAAFFARGPEATARSRRVECGTGQRHCGTNECYRPEDQICCHCPHGIGQPIPVGNVCPDRADCPA
jgi:hypothetical protein